MTASEKVTRIFRSLSAGMTTILPTGRKIIFGGSIIKGDLDVKVGHGYYQTTNQDEINWLESLTKMDTPQVWEEVATGVVEPTEQPVPANVAAGSPAEAAVITAEINKQASTAAEAIGKVDSRVAALMNKAAAAAGR